MTTDNNETDTTLYTATFKLEQTGPEGDVKSSLTFTPDVDQDEPVFVHRAMSMLAHAYLFQAGVIDREGNPLVNMEEDEDGGLRVTGDMESTAQH